MAVSGTISATTFNTARVTDQAFRRCRLSAQQITAEMHSYAKDALYLLLSEMGNVKTPSWCVEKQLYPMYQGQYQIPLDIGTVTVLNANLRTVQEVTGKVDALPTSYTVDFTNQDGGVGTVNTVGVKWSAASVAVTFEVSTDGLTWATSGAQGASANAGSWTWTDITPANAYTYFRITSTGVISASEIFLGTLPQEIPMGMLNRDTYSAQSNKAFQGRPLTAWFQRDRTQPVLNLWPAPNLDAEHQQMVIWRHRHIMDVGSLSQEIEVPQRWLEAIIAMLAAKMALETPAVDMNIVPLLDSKAAVAYTLALAGDNSGAPTFIQSAIACYTR